MANKILRLDISKIPDLTPIIYGRVADGLVQTVDVYVTNNGEPFDLTGWVINFEGNTSGNRTYVKDLEGIVMVDRTKGHFTYTFPLIAFSTAGKYERAYFSFVKGDQRESTSDFNIQVFENADITVEEAHTVITEYEELVDELNRIFLEAQTELQQDFDEFKKNYDTRYNNYITDLTNKINAAQNKIDILNSNYEKTNAKLTDLEERMNDLVNDGLLKMEDVLSFLAGKNVKIKVPIDFAGKISGSTAENPNVMKFGTIPAANINSVGTVNDGTELISDDVAATMWKNYKNVSALDGKLAQAQQTLNGQVTFHLARIDAVSEISRRFPNLFINVGATTRSQQKEQLIKKATFVSATAYGFGSVGDVYKYTIGRSNWTTTGTTWQGWTGWGIDNNSHSSSKPDPVTAGVGSVDTIMDQNGVMAFIMGVPTPSDGTKMLRTNLDYFVCEITLNLNINDLIPKPDLSKYYTKDEMNEAFTEHSLYSNSLDFGNYDYSGNANLMTPLKASDFYKVTGGTIEDIGNALKVTFTKTDGATFLETMKSVPALLPNKQYTLSADVTVTEGYSGKLENLRLGYRKSPNGTIILPLTAKDAQVGKKTKIFITANSSSATDPSIFDRMYFTINTTSTEPFVGTVLIENIKVEEGSTATPYQPNLLDEPYYLSKAVWGENLIDPAVKFPITSSVETLYSGRTPEDFVEGETYTVTIGATKPSAQSFGVYLALKNHTIFKPVEGLHNTWTATLKIDILGEKKNAVYIYQSPASSVGACQIDWLKIEKGDTRTPNLNAPFKYKGIGFTKSSNPKDYNWNSAPENVDFIEKNAASNEAKIDEIDKNVVKTSGNQNITGLKNFTGTLQSSGVEVAKKGDSYTKTETYTKTEVDSKYIPKTQENTFVKTIGNQNVVGTKNFSDPRKNDALMYALTDEAMRPSDFNFAGDFTKVMTARSMRVMQRRLPWMKTFGWFGTGEGSANDIDEGFKQYIQTNSTTDADITNYQFIRKGRKVQFFARIKFTSATGTDVATFAQVPTGFRLSNAAKYTYWNVPLTCVQFNAPERINYKGFVERLGTNNIKIGTATYTGNTYWYGEWETSDPYPTSFTDEVTERMMAHRGATVSYPENTLEAFKAAIDLGYGGVELDPRLTSDGKLYLMHDDTVDRTTNGTGNFADLTEAQVKALNIKIDPVKYPNLVGQTLKVPSLSSVLLALRGTDLTINFDGSKIDLSVASTAKMIHDMIVSYGLEKRVFFVINNKTQRDAFHKLYPQYPVSWLWNSPGSRAAGTVNEIYAYGKHGGALLSIPMAVLNDDTSMRDIQASGVYYQVYGVQTEADYETCRLMRVPMIETDQLYPNLDFL
ncbi:glycerophosphoryl diester phosphodiesterase [Enterococcus phage TJE4]|uniref:Minor tail protein n=1 Tax=Enterococcus phage 9183 TaxID=2763102 RepID=A0A7L7SQP7_9CAUD|nr:minor tail protein [Enterococcus phage 9183]QOC57578.1 minor tail protein [Enterococcus phage 9183]UVD42807.1 glycerophosphoryl diester phosphodiesterase [Enterococcus phage TJE4]